MSNLSIEKICDAWLMQPLPASETCQEKNCKPKNSAADSHFRVIWRQKKSESEIFQEEPKNLGSWLPHNRHSQITTTSQDDFEQIHIGKLDIICRTPNFLPNFARVFDPGASEKTEIKWYYPIRLGVEFYSSRKMFGPILKAVQPVKLICECFVFELLGVRNSWFFKRLTRLKSGPRVITSSIFLSGISHTWENALIKVDDDQTIMENFRPINTKKDVFFNKLFNFE